MACHEILHEDLGKRKINADSCKSKRWIVLQFVPTFWKLQAKRTHSALPSSLVMKHGAYSKTHKQKHKVQSGEAQTHLPQRNPASSLKKNNVYCVFRLQREGICSKGSNCKPRCLHRCTATFMQEHSILSPWVVGNREVVPPTQRVAAYSIICQIFVSTSNHCIVTCTIFSSFVPCNFFLFSWLKLALKGHCYADMQAIQTFMTKQLCSIPKSAFKHCFKDL